MIYLGCDHGGFALKNAILQHLQRQGRDCVDCGNTHFDAEDDFPDYVEPVVQGVLQDEKNFGILVCGSGIGVSIAANHHRGIRAALVHDENYARLSRQHNHANVLCLGGRFVAEDLAMKIVDVFLNTPVDPNPKYERRMRAACKE